MKRLTSLLIIALTAATTTMAATVERPKLVVGIVVDQMRWDYLYYYRPLVGDNGLNRLLDQGFSVEDTKINYTPTVTAIGHASVYTGSVPAFHGILGNDFYIGNRETYCCGDSTVSGVGSTGKAGQMSPRNLQASTIGDELHLATDFKAKVVGIALKDRAAILPAGHSADAAYWYDKNAKAFITSSFYMKELPQWVSDFNNAHRNDIDGSPLLSPKGVKLTFQMAEAALKNMELGQHDVTDLLAISISSTDAIAHDYGLRDPLTKESYMELDRQIEAFLNILDNTVGKGEYLLFLTADHGGAFNYNDLASHRIPAGAWQSWSDRKRLNDHLRQRFPEAGDRDLMLGENMGRIYLNHDNIAAAGLELSTVKQEMMDFLLKDERFQHVVDYKHVADATLPQPLREQICNGYHPMRSGDIFVVPRPQVVITFDSPTFRGTSHGLWNPYDAHIPFLLYGWHIPHGATTKPAAITDIAATICSLLHIQAPNACIGKAVEIIPDK